MDPATIDLLKYGTAVVALCGVIYHFGKNLGLITAKLESIETILHMAVGEVRDDVKELEEDVEETGRRVTTLELRQAARSQCVFQEDAECG